MGKVKYYAEVIAYFIVQNIIMVFCLAESRILSAFGPFARLTRFLDKATGISTGGVGSEIVEKVALILAIILFLGDLCAISIVVMWHKYQAKKNKQASAVQEVKSEAHKATVGRR